MADARKVLALSSVTNVLGVLVKPGLDAWKIEQGIVSALTLPRHPGEELGDFAHRVVADNKAVKREKEGGLARGGLDHGLIPMDTEEKEAAPAYVSVSVESGLDDQVLGAWSSPKVVDVPTHEFVGLTVVGGKTRKRHEKPARQSTMGPSALENGSDAEHVDDRENENCESPPGREASPVVFVHVGYLNTVLDNSLLPSPR